MSISKTPSSLISDPIQKTGPETYVITGKLTEDVVERILNLGAKEITLNACTLKEKHAEILTDFGATQRIVFNKCIVKGVIDDCVPPSTGQVEKTRQDIQDVTLGILKVEGRAEFYDPHNSYNEIPDALSETLDARGVGHVQWIDPQALIAERIVYAKTLCKTIDEELSKIQGSDSRDFIAYDLHFDKLNMTREAMAPLNKSIMNLNQYISTINSANAILARENETLTEEILLSQLKDLNEAIESVEKTLEAFKIIRAQAIQL